MLKPEERDALYAECSNAITAAIERAGPDSESLFLARAVLLLMEEVGDAPRCRKAIAAALDGLEPPSLSARPDAEARVGGPAA